NHATISSVARATVRRRGERSSATPARAGKLPDNLPVGGRRRVVFEAVMPEVDAGRLPAKRAAGEIVTVEADVFADGHDALAAVLRYRILPIHGEVAPKAPEGLGLGWTEVPIAQLVNHRWRGEVPVTELGRYRFTIEGWVDPFETWKRQLKKRIDAGQDVKVELELGARMLEQAAARVDGDAQDAERLVRLAKTLRTTNPPAPDGEATELMRRYAD